MGNDRGTERPYDGAQLASESSLRGCDGFRVDSRDGRVGVVERIYPDPRSGRPRAIEIRVGLLHQHVRLAPVEWVAEIRPEARRIVLRAFPLDGHGHLGAGHASDDWLRALRGAEPIRRDAIASLHKVLLDAATFEVTRRRRTTPELPADQAIGVALASAEEALAAALSRLDEYVGQSRFTTWASKFALREAAVAMRRQAWHGRTVPIDAATAEASREFAAAAGGEEEGFPLSALREELTPRESAVLVATSIRQVPIDVLADRLGSTRDDLYRTLRAARRKLGRRLASRGLRHDRSSEPGVWRSEAGADRQFADGEPPDRERRRRRERLQAVLDQALVRSWLRRLGGRQGAGRRQGAATPQRDRRGTTAERPRSDAVSTPVAGPARSAAAERAHGRARRNRVNPPSEVVCLDRSPLRRVL